MALNINQFAQTTVQGHLDLEVLGTVVSLPIGAAQATPLVAGQAVKVDTSVYSGPTRVLAVASATDPVFGFVPYNMKDQSIPAGYVTEIARVNSVMYMTAAAAITRGAPVEYIPGTIKVQAWAGINTVVGYAYGSASADGDLIRVWIIDPLAVAPSVNTGGQVTVTLAQINAGATIIPGVAGRQIIVTSFVDRVTGAFTGGTNVLLQSSNVTPVVVATLAEAALTNGAVLIPGSANVTLGAGYGALLGAGDSLVIASTGTQAGGTNMAFTISYDLV